MKLAFNGATTMKASLVTDISAASAVGFNYLEIWAAKLYEYLKSNSAEELKKLFAEHNIRPLSINSIEHITFRTAEAYPEIRRQCAELSEIAAKLECPYIVVVPGKMPLDCDYERITSESIEVLRDLAEIAGRHNVSLAFEFLGEADCSVRTLDHCLEIVKMAAMDNIGFVIDTFHFYTGGSRFETIASIDPQKLFIFHINGAEDLPVAELTDAHRLYPGEGILPAFEIAGELDSAGYKGPASVEIFRPEYWEQDPFEVAKKAKYAAEGVLQMRVQVR
ncbi:MAG TPA: hypothetical protein DEA22_09380 [Blastocatellia bacterium]|nr:hypothetical protein [Blastocatellia bacterium]